MCIDVEFMMYSQAQVVYRYGFKIFKDGRGEVYVDVGYF